MKLIKASVRNYRSVEDSGEFDVGDLTCLVGKNEAGKTALLSAFRGLNPTDKFAYNKTNDYPRRFLNEFEERHPSGEAEIIKTSWAMDDNDKAQVVKRFGENVFTSDVIQISKGFGYKTQLWIFPLNQVKVLSNLAKKHALTTDDLVPLKGLTEGPEADAALAALTSRTPAQEALLADIKNCRGSSFILGAIDSVEMPEFFYASHFDRMSGEVSVPKLLQEVASKTVSSADQIFLDFLAYAKTSLEDLNSATRYVEQQAKLQSASSRITREMFEYWSQNKALKIKVDLHAGLPGDPAPFNTGTVASIGIENINHEAIIPLSERSAGFVWFFSFLAQFKELKKTKGNVIILLDEPGLTLHGKAQADLLRYMVDKLIPDHQVIFTTHSPFMVPMDRLADVRIVEDVIEVKSDGRLNIKGTKVSSDVLEVSDDTLFPLQGALGYEITQALFVGKNTLLVEGPSDIVYLDVLSQALKKRGREGLDSRWTICPSGGIDKIAPFARLFGRSGINIAVLSDRAKGDNSKLANAKSALLNAAQFYTIADFLDQAEADIEDLFDTPLFVHLLNKAYSPPSGKTVTVKKLQDADSGTVRSVKKAEALFRLMPSEVEEFDHFGPARWLMKNPNALDGDAAEVLTTLERAEKIFKQYNQMLST
jgi:predicted ATP-dependent endonuclease of OLD family